MTRGAEHIALLKKQWALVLSNDLRDVADALPEGHIERPGLIRAAEIVRATAVLP